MTEIFICCKTGTGKMLEVNLSSLSRHTPSDQYVAKVVKDANEGADSEIEALCKHYRAELYRVSTDARVLRKHGAMLDAVIPSRVSSEFFMTLDSDCFPVADGWLSGLRDMLTGDCKMSGVLHPWAPPPEDMKKTLLEWRVRHQHCWHNTHVACQMMRTEDFKTLDTAFVKGDDTGLDVVVKARNAGWKIEGYGPTRCPLLPDGNDMEFNRYAGVVYGDMVYHHGSWTLTTVCGATPMFPCDFAAVTDRVFTEKGAEFLLDDSVSYRYKFDREEEVAKDKIDRIFGNMSCRKDLT